MGHPIEIRIHDDGSESAYCARCRRNVYGPSPDARRVTMTAQAHVRVTCGPPANEFINAMNARSDGRMSQEMFDILNEERRAWRGSPRWREDMTPRPEARPVEDLGGSA